MTIAAFRAGYDKARTLFPLLPQFYELNLTSDTGIGHIRFMGLNVAGLPIFNYTTDALTEQEAQHEAGHAYKALLERKYPYRWFGQEYWDSRGFPSNYADAKQDAQKLTGMAAWIADPNESWAEAFRIAVSQDAAPPHQEHTMDYGKTINPAGVRMFFRSLLPTTAPTLPPDPPKVTHLNIITFMSPNYSRRHAAIKYIVLHTTQGNDSRSWLTNPASQVSAHYLVQRDQVYELVDEDDAAWHAGIIVGTPTTPLYDGTNPNEESIGIEMEGYAAIRLDDETLDSTALLIEDIYRRRGYLPLVSHSELSPGNRSDPGPQNRAAVEERVDDMAFTQADRDLLQRVKDILEAREGLVWAARGQRFLDVETGKPYDPNKPPQDKRIKI